MPSVAGSSWGMSLKTDSSGKVEFIHTVLMKFETISTKFMLFFHDSIFSSGESTCFVSLKISNSLVVSSLSKTRLASGARSPAFGVDDLVALDLS